MIRRLLVVLGLAATLATVAGASAADLPTEGGRAQVIVVKAPPAR